MTTMAAWCAGPAIFVRMVVHWKWRGNDDVFHKRNEVGADGERGWLPVTTSCHAARVMVTTGR
jgi:hypothetical protein